MIVAHIDKWLKRQILEKGKGTDEVENCWVGTSKIERSDGGR